MPRLPISRYCAVAPSGVAVVAGAHYLVWVRPLGGDHPAWARVRVPQPAELLGATVLCALPVAPDSDESAWFLARVAAVAAPRNAARHLRLEGVHEGRPDTAMATVSPDCVFAELVTLLA
ncbi:MAG: hypothetical protein FJ100_09320 [Deltaproteobacteria bacterium]|nr:hypothetical protein [Deltaproteobacteria bacterium]